MVELASFARAESNPLCDSNLADVFPSLPPLNGPMPVTRNTPSQIATMPPGHGGTTTPFIWLTGSVVLKHRSQALIGTDNLFAKSLHVVVKFISGGDATTHYFVRALAVNLGDG